MGLKFLRQATSSLPRLDTMLAPVRSVARPSVRAFSASPWGTDHWRHDKQAFKAWAQAAVQPGTNKEKRELYGFLALSFGDVDTDKDGLISAEQFDQLLAELSTIRSFLMSLTRLAVVPSPSTNSSSGPTR